MEMKNRVVHALYQGLPLCGFSNDVPASWPINHVWTYKENIQNITCPECKTQAQKQSKEYAASIVVTPKVVALYICQNAGDPMQIVNEARALVGAGLEGDRYSKAKGSWNEGELGKRQVSLIGLEGFPNITEELPAVFSPSETRRNILTEGIDLMSLIDKEFYIGDVRVFGNKYCAPCNRPDRLSHKKGFRITFAKTAGILVDIISSGTIRIGDKITLI